VDLGQRVADLLDHQLADVDLDDPLVLVDLDLDLGVGVKILPGDGEQRFLDGREKNVGIDAAFAADLLDALQQIFCH